MIATLAKWIAAERTTNAAASHIATVMSRLMAMPHDASVTYAGARTLVAPVMGLTRLALLGRASECCMLDQVYALKVRKAEEEKMRNAPFVMLTVALTAGYFGSATADETMTGDQLAELLAGGKTIMLGGPGTGYAGELVLTADGKGKGEAKTDDGSKTFVIQGTWEIRDDKFCRTWAEISEGKEVCETWVVMAPKKVKVMDGEKELGVNYWE